MVRFANFLKQDSVQLYFGCGANLENKNKLNQVLVDITDGEYDDTTDANQDLLLNGVIDSFGFVQLLMSLKQDFGVEVSEEEQLDVRLRSVNGLLEFIQQKSEK